MRVGWPRGRKMMREMRHVWEYMRVIIVEEMELKLGVYGVEEAICGSILACRYDGTYILSLRLQQGKNNFGCENALWHKN